MTCPNFLSHITPVIATYNEAPNIERTLDGLTWAKRIVIVDSYNDDDTLDIVARYPARVINQRKFDTFAGQWTWVLENCDLSSGWILALDADFVLTPEHVTDMAGLAPSDNMNGYVANFRYCVNGKPYALAFTRLELHCFAQSKDGSGKTATHIQSRSMVISVKS